MGGWPPLPIEDARTISGEEIQSLRAGKIQSGTISAQKIILSDDADSVLQSGNYDAGTAGWQILGDGDAEFNNVTVRGTLLSVTGTNEIEADNGILTITDGTRSIIFDPSGFGASSGIEIEFDRASGASGFLQHTDSGTLILQSGGSLTEIGGLGETVHVSATGTGTLRIGATDGGGEYALRVNGGDGVGGQGDVFSGAIRDTTTGSAANVFINSTSGKFARSTSSVRYKTDLEPWDRRHSVLDVTPTLFRSLATDDDPEVDRLGFIAEDVAEHFPLAALRDDQGRPDAVDWNSIVAGLIAEVKALRKELAHAD